MDAYEVPDGGYGWIICLSAAIICFLSEAFVGIFSVSYLELVHAFGANYTIISWIGGVSSLLNTFMINILNKPLFKKFGYRPGGFLGPALLSTGFFAASFTGSVWLLIGTFGIMPALGSTVSTMSGSTAINEWFEIRRPVAIAIPYIGSSIGTMSWPQLAGYTNSLYSWRGTMMIAAAIQLHGFLCIALLRRPPRQNQPNKNNYENLTNSDNNMDTAPHLQADLKTYILFFALITCVYGGHYVTLAYLPTIATMNGISKFQSRLLISMVGLMGIVFRPLAGSIGIKIKENRVWLLASCLVTSSVLSAILCFLPTHALFIIYAVCFGIYSSTYDVLAQSLCLDLWHRDHLVLTVSVLFSAASFGSFLGFVLPGIAMDVFKNASSAFAVCSFLHAAAFLFLLLILRLRKKKKTVSYGATDQQPHVTNELQ